jgi:hypothetical protein
MRRQPRIITLDGRSRSGVKRVIIKTHASDCDCATCERHRLQDMIDIAVAGRPTHRIIFTTPLLRDVNGNLLPRWKQAERLRKMHRDVTPELREKYGEYQYFSGVHEHDDGRIHLDTLARFPSDIKNIDQDWLTERVAMRIPGVEPVFTQKIKRRTHRTLAAYVARHLVQDRQGCQSFFQERQLCHRPVPTATAQNGAAGRPKPISLPTGAQAV